MFLIMRKQLSRSLSHLLVVDVLPSLFLFCYVLTRQFLSSFSEILAPIKGKKRITAINPALLRSIDSCFLQEDRLIFGLVVVSLLCNQFSGALNHAAFFYLQQS
ncbi:hypothetical protein EUGRSUZ_L02981 [Eucalyptus grandis]|uniref:Uncharacterized protein n=1 Tax=Eucalyptus grandis TaxID=71139 RepID=A0AAD9T8H6_EUCGR|nr:hypothetical protein EUGRSUZ_L02981 [Eucalyptus grandis]